MPTIKQKKVFKRTLENNGVVSTAMLEVGYSPNSAKNPKIVTGSKGWQELLDTLLSDDKLTKVHNKLLNKKEVLIISDGAKEGSHYEFTEQPHSDASKALDMAYKLKRKYESEEVTNNVIIVNISPEGSSKYAIKSAPIINP